LTRKAFFCILKPQLFCESCNLEADASQQRWCRLRWLHGVAAIGNLSFELARWFD
jgi:hypothetical protein